MHKIQPFFPSAAAMAMAMAIAMAMVVLQTKEISNNST